MLQGRLGRGGGQGIGMSIWAHRPACGYIGQQCGFRVLPSVNTFRAVLPASNALKRFILN